MKKTLKVLGIGLGLITVCVIVAVILRPWMDRWAATFFVLWLRRSLHTTSWAKYPAIALAVVAGIMFLLGAGFQTYWPLALIVAGIVVLYFGFRPKTQVDQ